MTGCRRKKGALVMSILGITFVLYVCGTNRSLYYAVLNSIPDQNFEDLAPDLSRWKRNYPTEDKSQLYKVGIISCPLLWTGDIQEQKLAQAVTHVQNRTWKSLADYNARTSNCEDYLKNTGFIETSVSEEESSFPLAFSILVYKDADQVERLLRAIYRPHNVHCIHVDLNSPPQFREKIELISRCLPNVFLSDVSVSVTWGTFTVLEPEIICMRQLLEHPVKWRYFINLTGQEFPLKTNKELVRILTASKGVNLIAKDSWDFSYRWEDYLDSLPSHYNLNIVKGDLHIAAVRGFVDYAVNSNVARELLAWLKPIDFADEIFFNTLNYNTQLGVPGSPAVETAGQKGYLVRYKVWCFLKGLLCDCQGKIKRNICQLGIGDLPKLTSSPAMFANKFPYDFQPLAYDCLEQWLLYKVRQEELGNPAPLDMSVYEHSWFVHNRYTGHVKIW